MGAGIQMVVNDALQHLPTTRRGIQYVSLALSHILSLYRIYKKSFTFSSNLLDMSHKAFFFEGVCV